LLSTLTPFRSTGIMLGSHETFLAASSSLVTGRLACCVARQAIFGAVIPSLRPTSWIPCAPSSYLIRRPRQQVAREHSYTIHSTDHGQDQSISPGRGVH
jgi:hypothetical protein